VTKQERDGSADIAALSIGKQNKSSVIWGRACFQWGLEERVGFGFA
jgi:hypothetical protein